MNETPPPAQAEDGQAVCSDCARLFWVETGAIVTGWDKVRHVTTSKLICGGCNAALIGRSVENALSPGMVTA